MIVRPFNIVMVVALVAMTFLAGCGNSPESLLASAKEYRAKKDHKAAVIQLKNALQKSPNLAEARFLLGRTLLDTGDVVSAEKELRRAYELKYPAEEVVPPLARALVAIGEYKKALEFADTAITAPAAKAELQTALGYAHLGLRNATAARDAFAAALAADSQYLPARLGQARMAASSRQFAQALELVESAIGTSSGSAEAWQLKGDILLFQGSAEPALAAYRKAMEVRADYLPSHAAIVSTLVQQNKLEEAGKQLDAMKRIAPKHPQTLYFQALHAYRQNRLPAAEAAIEQALSSNPGNLTAVLLASMIKLDLKAYAQSETHALKVLSRAPTQTLARRVLVTGYLRSGQTAKAIDAVTSALDKSEKDPLLLALVGEAYMMQGQHAQASQLFARAAKLEPGNTTTRTALGLSYLARGETDRAFTELEQAAAAGAGNRADLALIAAHLQRRSYNRALAAIAALEKKQPQTPMPHNLRGGVLLAKNDVPGARKSFERALELDPVYYPAAANLARLDLAEKKPEAARQRFEAMLAKDAKNLQALLALAGLRAQTGGSAAEVAALIDKAISVHPNHPAPRIALIRHHLRGKDTKKAVTTAQGAMTAVRDNVEVMNAAAHAHEAAGESNQALAIYAKATKLQPHSAEPYLRMAEVHLRAKNKDQALQSLREALVLKPDLVQAQRAVIAINLEDGRVQEAVAVAKEVQKQRPKQSIGFLLEGDIHASKKNWDAAAAAYRAGLKSADASDLAIRLHTVLGAGGKAAGAEQFAGGWLKTHPNDAAFRTHLATASLAGKDYQAAIQQYRKVLEKEPNNALVLNNLAWVLAQLKDPQAIQYAESAHKLAPDHPAIMDTLGVMLIEKGNTARGLELLRKASAAAPGAGDIRLNLARGLISAGQKAEAKKELDELAKLGDKFARQSEVTQLREQL